MNKDGDVIDAKDIIAVDKELDRIQQQDIDKRELRDKAKKITRGSNKDVTDIFKKQQATTTPVGREKR